MAYQDTLFGDAILSSTRISDFNHSKDHLSLSDDDDDEKLINKSRKLLTSQGKRPRIIHDDDEEIDVDLDYEEDDGDKENFIDENDLDSADSQSSVARSDNNCEEISPRSMPVKRGPTTLHRLPLFEEGNYDDTPFDQKRELNSQTSKNEDVDSDVLDKLRKLSKTARRVVKKPRPKLDTQKLLGEDGLPALLDHFKKTHFQGKGSEFQDLDKLLFEYESFFHQLISKYNFLEVIERLENLGSRRELRVVLHRLREGVWPPYASNAYVHDSDESDENDGETIENTWEKALNSVPHHNTFNQSQLPLQSNPQLEVDSSFVELNDIGVAGGSSPAINAELRAEQNRLRALERLKLRRSSQLGSDISTGNLLKMALKSSQFNSSINESVSVTQ